MKRVVLFGALLLAGCAREPTVYTHTAGPPLSEAQFQRINTICRGRAAQTPAEAPYGDAADRLAQTIIQGGRVDAAYEGCMAEHGLVAMEKR